MANVDPTTESVFFAYAGQPALRAEAIREAVQGCRGRGLEAHSWEDLSIGGRILIGAITEGISNCSACVAEISSNNPNVLFEAGYALARGKRLLLAIDESDSDATRNWSSLALVDTIGRINYGGNAQRLATQVFEMLSESAVPLMEELLVDARPREQNAIFAPSVPHKFNSAERLERLMERKTHLRLLASQDEFGLAPLSFYVQEIYRSSAAILHFMNPSRVRATTYNARLALLAGVVHGLDLPLLMVAEPEYAPPLDYKDLLFPYPSAAKLVEHVDGWLETLPTAPGTKRRLGRLKLDIELPIRSFGEYVAESEQEDLGSYFVETNEFEGVLAGRTAVFTGRKGTGKTANMQQAVTELRQDRRILVVPIKPSSYDLANLTSVLSRFQDVGKRDYFLLNLWSYLLATEIVLTFLSEAERRPAGLGADDNTAALAEAVAMMGIDRESDLSTRLDEAIASASTGDLIEASEALRVGWHSQLLPKLRLALRKYNRVAVLIDNLDKTWERGVDYRSLSQFLLALLVTSGRIHSEFERSRGGEPSANVTLTAFLRTDIFDVITRYAREPDKINPQSIQWADEELLIRVLEERYVARGGKSSALTPEDLWGSVFCSEVHSLPTRDYLLWRALRRPRDIIFLGNAALTTAINRRHGQVLAQDFAYAESTYSRFAVEALLVESEAQGLDLEGLLFEFAGLDSTLRGEELEEVFASRGDPDALADWLIRTSFLGLEARDGSFVYVEGEQEAHKKKKVAERSARREGRRIRYRVHPAFRPYLDVRDDDLHSESESSS